MDEVMWLDSRMARRWRCCVQQLREHSAWCAVWGDCRPHPKLRTAALDRRLRCRWVCEVTAGCRFVCTSVGGGCSTACSAAFVRALVSFWLWRAFALRTDCCCRVPSHRLIRTSFSLLRCVVCRCAVLEDATSSSAGHPHPTDAWRLLAAESSTTALIRVVHHLYGRGDHHVTLLHPRKGSEWVGTWRGGRASLASLHTRRPCSSLRLSSSLSPPPGCAVLCGYCFRRHAQSPAAHI